VQGYLEDFIETFPLDSELQELFGLPDGRVFSDRALAIADASADVARLAAFTAPPAGEFGNAGRNTIPGPNLLSVNAAFGRSFQFGESRRRLELRLEANNVSELSALLAAEAPGRTLVLDLKDVVLVDRDVVRFLRAREGNGIALRNCPPYIREWIAREDE
jgi:hypothetical protein